jgi:hypothetical protein
VRSTGELIESFLARFYFCIVILSLNTGSCSAKNCNIQSGESVVLCSCAENYSFSNMKRKNFTGTMHKPSCIHLVIQEIRCFKYRSWGCFEA